MKYISSVNSSAGKSTTSTWTKRTMRVLSIAALALLGISATSKAFATCNTPAMSGRYGLKVIGGTQSGVGKFLTGTLTFNGACGVTGDVSIGENNSVTDYASITGSYNLNSDNTFAISLTLPNESSPETYVVSYVPPTGEALGIETDTSASATITLKPQVFPAGSSAPAFTNASLQGSWTAECAAPLIGETDLNVVSFDGSTSNYGVFGNTTGTNYTNGVAPYTVGTFSGLYAVLSDGSFGGSLTLYGQAPFGFTGSIDNNGNELQYVIISTAGVIDSCVAKRVK